MRDGRQVVVAVATTCAENELAFQSQMGVLKWPWGWKVRGQGQGHYIVEHFGRGAPFV